MLLCLRTLNGSSASVPDGTAHNPNIFCTTPGPRHLGPFFYRVMVCQMRFLHLPNLWLEATIFACGRTPLHAVLAATFLSTNIHLSCGFGLSSSQSRHSSTKTVKKARCVLQCPVDLLSFGHCAAPYLQHLLLHLLPARPLFHFLQ